MELKHALHAPGMHHHWVREVRDAVYHDAHRFATRETIGKMRRLKPSLRVERKTLGNLAVFGEARSCVVLAACPVTSVKCGDCHESVYVVRRRRDVRNATYRTVVVVRELAGIAYTLDELWDASLVCANAAFGTHVGRLSTSNVPAVVAHVGV